MTEQTTFDKAKATLTPEDNKEIDTLKSIIEQTFAKLCTRRINGIAALTEVLVSAAMLGSKTEKEASDLVKSLCITFIHPMARSMAATVVEMTKKLEENPERTMAFIKEAMKDSSVSVVLVKPEDIQDAFGSAGEQPKSPTRH